MKQLPKPAPNKTARPRQLKPVVRFHFFEASLSDGLIIVFIVDGFPMADGLFIVERHDNLRHCRTLLPCIYLFLITISSLGRVDNQPCGGIFGKNPRLPR